MKRTGGVNRRDHPVTQDVEFPGGYASQMFEYLSPHFYKPFDKQKPVCILDSCCGENEVLGKAIEKVCNDNGQNVITRGIDIKKGGDIFQLHNSTSQFDIIVCNPPWKLKLALPIYNHLVTLLRENGVLFFIINNVFRYQGPDRAAALRDQKFYFLPRWVFKPSGRPLLDCGVSVLHNDGIIPAPAAALPAYIPLNKEDL